MKKIKILAIILCLLCVCGFTLKPNTELEREQELAHEAAEIIRELGYSEDSVLITTLQNHWWDAEARKVTSPYEGLNISETDKELVAALVWAEARGEPYEGQVAVAEVVFNRLLDGYWGDSVEDVIYAPYQFAGIGGYYAQEQLDAVNDALLGQVLGDTSVMYFRANYYHGGREPYTRIGNHYFSR